jgi:hypothetical protein
MQHHLPRWFQLLKYTIYGLLMLNTWLFLQEELVSLDRLFADGINRELLIQAFSATIDTAAWVVLLLMFELETYVIPDEKIEGAVKWGLHGLRAFCYLFIFSACWGYISEMLYYYEVAPLSVADACNLVGKDWSILVKLDEFVDLTADTCGTLQGELWQVGAGGVVADGDKLSATRWLAWTDVINSATWILVVLVLEADVRLQLRGAYAGRWLLASKVSKVVLYGILFAAAVYWGFEGDFLDFWDAFLWLFAFFFIEQNLFAWQQETELENQEAAAHQQ